jgi:hypothetical protein
VIDSPRTVAIGTRLAIAGHYHVTTVYQLRAGASRIGQMPPSAEEQIAFLTKVQRILTEGQFTATYKYALLLALADLAVEIGDDSGAAVAVPTRLIAEKFVQYYWRHVIPYLLPAGAGVAGVLKQNTDRQAAVVKYVQKARQRFGDSLAALRHDSKRGMDWCAESKVSFGASHFGGYNESVRSPLIFCTQTSPSTRESMRSN